MTNFLDLPLELRDLVYGFYFTSLLQECRGSGKYQPALLSTSRSISVEAAEVHSSYPKQCSPTRRRATHAVSRQLFAFIAAEAKAATQKVDYQVDELRLSHSQMHGREHDEIVNIIEQIIDCAAPGQSHWPKWRTHAGSWKTWSRLTRHSSRD